MVFYDIKPLAYTDHELLVSLILGFMLHIKHRWEITLFQFYILNKEFGLLLCRRIDAIEMVGTTSKTILASLKEVFFEVRVYARCSLRSFYHNKAYGELIYHTLILQLSPVDFSLMVTHINAVNLITLRIADIAI